MYKVTFIDGTIFEGGSPDNSKWNEIPNKPIQSIEYAFTPFLRYLFSDFEEYNHCVERIKGINQACEAVTSVIVMGKIKNRVYQVMIDQTGAVYQMVVPYGQEYSPQRKIDDSGKFAGWVNAKPLTGGWKIGNLQKGASPRLRKLES